jgi:hypothetical protein
LVESESVSDLRKTPMLLALMCTLYLREHYIPDNRPEIYEQCALMLLDSGTDGGGIRPLERLESLVDLAMKHWLIGSTPTAKGRPVYLRVS